MGFSTNRFEDYYKKLNIKKIKKNEGLKEKINKQKYAIIKKIKEERLKNIVSSRIQKYDNLKRAETLKSELQEKNRTKVMGLVKERKKGEFYIRKFRENKISLIKSNIFEKPKRRNFSYHSKKYSSSVEIRKENSVKKNVIPIGRESIENLTKNMIENFYKKLLKKEEEKKKSLRTKMMKLREENYKKNLIKKEETIQKEKKKLLQKRTDKISSRIGENSELIEINKIEEKKSEFNEELVSEISSNISEIKTTNFNLFLPSGRKSEGVDLKKRVLEKKIKEKNVQNSPKYRFSMATPAKLMTKIRNFKNSNLKRLSSGEELRSITTNISPNHKKQDEFDDMEYKEDDFVIEDIDINYNEENLIEFNFDEIKEEKIEIGVSEIPEKNHLKAEKGPDRVNEKLDIEDFLLDIEEVLQQEKEIEVGDLPKDQSIDNENFLLTEPRKSLKVKKIMIIEEEEENKQMTSLQKEIALKTTKEKKKDRNLLQKEDHYIPKSFTFGDLFTKTNSKKKLENSGLGLLGKNGSNPIINHISISKESLRRAKQLTMQNVIKEPPSIGESFNYEIKKKEETQDILIENFAMDFENNLNVSDFDVLQEEDFEPRAEMKKQALMSVFQKLGNKALNLNKTKKIRDSFLINLKDLALKTKEEERIKEENRINKLADDSIFNTFNDKNEKKVMEFSIQTLKLNDDYIKDLVIRVHKELRKMEEEGEGEKIKKYRPKSSGDSRRERLKVKKKDKEVIIRSVTTSKNNEEFSFEPNKIKENKINFFNRKGNKSKDVKENKKSNFRILVEEEI